MKHRTIGVHAPHWPVGMWKRSGVWPPLVIERHLERWATGKAPSIYTPKALQHRPETIASKLDRLRPSDVPF